jgi:polar amino acid transport system substrate-binding protein
MTRSTRRLVALIFVIAIGALVVAGCGSSKKKDTTTATEAVGPAVSATTPAASGADAAIAASVPAKIKSAGTLKVAADATYPPLESIAKDGKTVVGADADLAKALGAVMGLKVSVVNQTFDSIIPGLQAGKYDMGMSSFTDTKEREKVVDFVTYLTAGTSFFEKTSGPDVEKLADLCGHTVAVEKGTTQEKDATAQSKKCKVTVSVFPDQTGANQALHSGRADVVMADTPPSAYAVNSSAGAFKLSKTSYANAPYGIALPKGNGMTAPVLAAIKVLMTNGQYKAILKKWGLDTGEITDPAINGATS